MSKDHSKYAFEVGGVDFASDDDTLDGRQVRSRSGHNPAANFRLIQIHDRRTSSIGLEDPVSLRDEKPIFMCVEGDRGYDFTVNDLGWEWGASSISEADVRRIGKIGEDREIVVETIGEPEIIIPQGGMIDLSGKKVERIFSRKVEAAGAIRLKFVVNGVPTTVSGKPTDQLKALLERALKDSENTGQPVDNWQVTDEPGHVLDVTKTLADLGLKDQALLLVSLKAGAAG